MESFEISEKDSKLLSIIEKLVAEGVAKGIKNGLEQARNEERLKEKLTFDIKLKNDKKEKLKQIIDNNYYEDRGYAFQTLTGNSKTTGAFKNYSVARYNDNFLKLVK